MPASVSEEYRRAIGSAIKQARKERGMSQDALRRAVGNSKNAVSNWERGKSAPTTESLRDLCRVLDVTPQRLLVMNGTAPAGGVPERNGCPRTRGPARRPQWGRTTGGSRSHGSARGRRTEGPQACGRAALTRTWGSGSDHRRRSRAPAWDLLVASGNWRGVGGDSQCAGLGDSAASEVGAHPSRTSKRQISAAEPSKPARTR